jgi:membrane associated rhomboid family serine protease
MIVLPLADPGVPWKRTPWVWALIGVNALVMAIALLRPDPESFIMAGALDPRQLRPLTFVSSMFLHGSIGHLVGNMLFLWGVGRPIHHRLGGRLFLAAYLITGLAAGFSYAIFTPAHPVVGASGAVSGLMGLFLTLWPGRRMRIAYWIGKGGLLRPRAYWALGLWIGLQIWSARSDDGTDHVAYAAHIGGFGAGAAIGLLLRLRVAPGPVREWMLEAPEPEQEERAGHLARAVMHNLQLGATEPMARAWDDWESGRAHVGFSAAELGRVQGDFQRRGDATRARQSATWRRMIFGT